MRRPLLTATVVFALAGALWWSTPSAVDAPGAVPEPPADPDAWLAAHERTVDETYGLVAGTEKRIRWQRPGERTRYAVVYLHGFSATRQEIAPTAERVADRLGANLFETRLAGHGHRTAPMDGVRAEDWLVDGIEALRIGRQLGDRVIVIGTSTGATLAIALVDQAEFAHVTSLVLISPNIAPADPKAEWLVRPAGPLIGRLVSGETRSWTPHNAQQARYWSTTYPLAAAVEVMRLVARARTLTDATINAGVLVLMSDDDSVVSPGAVRDAFAQFDANDKRLVRICRPGDPSSHVLAGDILSPNMTMPVAEVIARYVNDGVAPSELNCS